MGPIRWICVDVLSLSLNSLKKKNGTVAVAKDGQEHGTPSINGSFALSEMAKIFPHKTELLLWVIMKWLGLQNYEPPNKIHTYQFAKLKKNQGCLLLLYDLETSKLYVFSSTKLRNIFRDYWLVINNNVVYYYYYFTKL